MCKLNTYMQNISIALMLCLFTHSAFANDLVIGQPAPDITLTTLEGKHIALHDLRGKTVILTSFVQVSIHDEIGKIGMSTMPEIHQ